MPTKTSSCTNGSSIRASTIPHHMMKTMGNPIITFYHKEEIYRTKSEKKDKIQFLRKK